MKHPPLSHAPNPMTPTPIKSVNVTPLAVGKFNGMLEKPAKTNNVIAAQLDATRIPKSQSIRRHITKRSVAATVQVLARDKANPRMKAKMIVNIRNKLSTTRCKH
jgi:hypothetical protein